MSAMNVTLAAQALAEAFRSGLPLERWPGGGQMDDVETAYKVQDALHREMGWAIGGWKVGWTSERLQRQNGVAEPMAGRVPLAGLLASGATVPVPFPDTLKCEAEFAFQLATSLPARRPPYTAEEVLEAVGDVHIAIEVVGSRLAAPGTFGRFAVVADNGAHLALVLGAKVPGWRGLDLPSHAVSLSVDGATVARGSGAEVLGNPVTPLLWLAEWRRVAGDGLEAGEIVTTGSCLGVVKVPVSAEIVADFGSLGQVLVDFLPVVS